MPGSPDSEPHGQWVVINSASASDATQESVLAKRKGPAKRRETPTTTSPASPIPSQNSQPGDSLPDVASMLQTTLIETTHRPPASSIKSKDLHPIVRSMLPHQYPGLTPDTLATQILENRHEVLGAEEDFGKLKSKIRTALGDLCVAKKACRKRTTGPKGGPAYEYIFQEGQSERASPIDNSVSNRLSFYIETEQSGFREQSPLPMQTPSADANTGAAPSPSGQARALQHHTGTNQGEDRVHELASLSDAALKDLGVELVQLVQLKTEGRTAKARVSALKAKVKQIKEEIESRKTAETG
ncbi:hypothetical protein LTR95_001545 [Oleoguttula sp. CCFEE 5521]